MVFVSLINERIVNGQNASLGEFPWMVSVMIDYLEKGNDSKPVEVTDLCGGAYYQFVLDFDFSPMFSYKKVF
jgi:secreted trypsin-like serine protease